MSLLTGKRIVISGLLDEQSIAHAVAASVQRHGADVILTNVPGHRFAMMRRAAKSLPAPPVAMIPADFGSAADLDRFSTDVAGHWDHVDGVLHSVAHAPRGALDSFLDTSWDDAARALHVSAFSLKDLVRALHPLLTRAPGGASVVSLDFDGTQAWPGYNWMGVSKSALEAISRYLARELGPDNIRVNTVAAGPVHSRAAGGVPSFTDFEREWSARAPLSWDADDADAVAGPVTFLFSVLAQAVTGTVLHADGGFHAMGMAGPQPLEAVAENAVQAVAEGQGAAVVVH
ncbi:enoyl-ACP reductase [Streptomyces sp. NPDC087440]|uniref:enoyl-ACP reductase FabI n=1 Tax=Streptomyces sp. NPDC087440 TaxID=3365790 RepID=UPI0037FFDDDF